MRKLQLHPAAPRLARHPAPLVAVAPVVDELRLVAIRRNIVARRAELRPRVRERHVRAGRVEHFQLVHAGLQTVRCTDGKAQALRAHGHKPVGVHRCAHRRPDHAIGAPRHGRLRELREAPGKSRIALTRRLGLFLSSLHAGRPQFAIFILHARDKGLHRVVVLRRDGIELVVMAPCAANAEAEKRLPDIGHHFI